MTVSTHTERPRRRGLLGSAAALLVTAAMALVPASPAAAHHGWDGFETNNLVYIAGTVSSEGNWGDPHSLFDVTLDAQLPANTPELPIPEDLSGPEDSVRIQAALAYDGRHDELEVIIAPPWWSSSNGLDRTLEVGEGFQGVGYINSTDDGLFRPVAFWYGDGNAPVNQVIGNTLPVRAPLPGTAQASGPPTRVPSTVEDPTELTPPAQGAGNADNGSGTQTWLVWAVFGSVVVVAVAAGTFYVRRRTRDDERNQDA
ncbi:hypothetical protein J2790_003848 [Paenarthrobacter nicotinovorans]|uniref:hypothetical protein n=1 Tax=Micrococcaceae TaxID=1268 RepID=UPI0008765BEE|nr:MULTISPECIES: hypothetical protein [Micrococcaceae]MDR6438681.1 hypothetical protein [Paenarthrobacter nicotinovorans]SCZ56564.1 hypothetical protein SAMN02799638_01890 [Arthrobacter sp. UNCCL28]